MAVCLEQPTPEIETQNKFSSVAVNTLSLELLDFSLLKATQGCWEGIGRGLFGASAVS
jgi:hypothetical protein